jgi:hypothetical protein
LSWDIESGLHQRLDVSCNDDRCTIQHSKPMLIMGMFRRLASSLFMEWRSHQRRPDHESTADLQCLMGANHAANAMRLITIKRPSLKSLSGIGADARIWVGFGD